VINGSNRNLRYPHYHARGLVENPMARPRDETERKWTELSGITFVFIFLCGSRNKYRNTRNKYENRYFQKHTWNEYGANTNRKQMIIGTNSCNHAEKLKQVK
jgi:hypothetical protein